MPGSQNIQTTPLPVPDPKKAAALAVAHTVIGISLSLAATGVFAMLWHTIKDKNRYTTAFDRYLLTWMHMHQVPWLTQIATVLAFLGSPPTIVAIATLGTLIGLVWRKIRGAAWTLPLAVAGAGIIIQAIKLDFRRERPTLFPQLLHETGYSFPSGHSVIAIVVYGLLGYFLMRLLHSHKARLAVGVATTILIVAIGLSRIYVEVHYPTDVLAGWAAGLPWLIACMGLHTRIAKHFAPTQEARTRPSGFVDTRPTEPAPTRG